MKCRVSSLMLTAVLTLVACGDSAGQARKPPAQTEADKVAQTFWESHLSKCGDSYVAAQPSTIFGGVSRFTQIVGVKFVQAASQLNDADRLNGVEWNGDFYVTATARRDYDPKSVESGFPADWSWQAWKGDVRVPRQGIFHFSATKIRGKWLVDNGSSGYGPVWEALETFNGYLQMPISKAPCDTFPAR